MDGNDVYYRETCDSFQQFLKDIDWNRKLLVCLNPKDGIVGGREGPLGANKWYKLKDSKDEEAMNQLNETMKLLLRSSFTQCLITFESYLHNLLGEAFDVICSTPEATFQLCRKIFVSNKQDQSKHAQKSPQGQQNTNTSQHEYKSLNQYKSLIQYREQILEEFTQPKLGHIKRTLFKLGGEYMTTETDKSKQDRLFNLLFIKEKPFTVDFQIPMKNVLEITPNVKYGKAKFLIEDIKTVEALLNLFYGIRCICSHGYSKKTIGQQGCLSDFDSSHLKFIVQTNYQVGGNDNIYQLTPEIAVAYFEFVYQKVVETAKADPAAGMTPMTMNYHLYLNTQSFLRTFGENLATVVGCYAYRMQDKPKSVSLENPVFWNRDVETWKQLADRFLPAKKSQMTKSVGSTPVEQRSEETN